MYEEFKEVYNRNAEKMELAKAMYESAMKRGDKETARKYRAEYSSLKSEVDVYAMQLVK